MLGVDAAILFSDILTPVEPMGLKLDFVPGPVFENPVRTRADMDALRIPEMEEDVPYVLEAIKILRRELEGRVPLIGFGGAPFTLACYMVEGKGSKDFAQIKRMMYAAPELYAELMEKVTEMDRQYLNAQIAAGAQAVQIFDTWGGILSPLDYERYILPYTKELIAGLDRRNSGHPLRQGRRDDAGIWSRRPAPTWSASTGTSPWTRPATSSDPRWPCRAISIRPFSTPPRPTSRGRCKRILDENAGRPGHIFNLGHGILPTVDPEHAVHGRMRAPAERK